MYGLPRPKESPNAVTDPLQEVLAAESAARARIDETRTKLESELRAVRIDANRIKERNERRTRVAVENAEAKCADKTRCEIEKLEAEYGRQLTLDDASIEKRLDQLAQAHVDQLWPE